jgi:hypothetical protein
MVAGPEYFIPAAGRDLMQSFIRGDHALHKARSLLVHWRAHAHFAVRLNVEVRSHVGAAYFKELLREEVMRAAPGEGAP